MTELANGSERTITLVTGATGFVGRHLVRRLVESGASVRATDRAGVDRSVLAGLALEFIEADLTLPESLPPLFEGRVERVFHVGAVCNLTVPYARLRPINVEGVDRITRLALAANVKRFVHMSSTSVYGAYRGTPFVEPMEARPQDDYGRSKRDGEAVVRRAMAGGLRATVLRPCTVYGPGCNEGAGKVFSRPTSITAIPGSGEQRLANVRVEDVAAAAETLSQLDCAVGETYNVVDDSNPRLAEALTLAAEAFGTRAPRRHVPLVVLSALALGQHMAWKWTGKIPDLEFDAVRFLRDDYVVDGTKLRDTGFRLRYPSFAESMRALGVAVRSEEKR